MNRDSPPSTRRRAIKRWIYEEIPTLKAICFAALCVEDKLGRLYMTCEQMKKLPRDLWEPEYIYKCGGYILNKRGLGYDPHRFRGAHVTAYRPLVILNKDTACERMQCNRCWSKSLGKG